MTNNYEFIQLTNQPTGVYIVIHFMTTLVISCGVFEGKLVILSSIHCSTFRNYTIFSFISSYKTKLTSTKPSLF